MKAAKRLLHFQRGQIDEELKPWMPLSGLSRPRQGWLKAVREALGVTTRQLAALLGTDGAAITRLEGREKTGTVTIQALDRAARAMGCRFIYAIVPAENSLESILDKKAHAAALSILQPVEQSMRLEKQGVAASVAKRQVESLAKELKDRLDPVIWRKQS